MPNGDRRRKPRLSLAALITRLYGDRWQRKFVSLALFALMFMPPLILAVDGYARTEANLRALTFSRRATIASIAAVTVEQNLNRLVDLNRSFASRVNFRRLVAEGKWTEAVAIMKEAPDMFPDIDLVFLADIRGTVQAATPDAPDIIGGDYSYRDWYRGVMAAQAPYVSEVYIRANEPKIRLVTVAGPIRSETGEIVGILAMQIPTSKIATWENSFDTGDDSFIYVTDHHGRLVSHPRYEDQTQVIDFSEVPAVQAALRGKSGVLEQRNPLDQEDRIAAYAPVAKYGWTVVAAQGAAAADRPIQQGLDEFAVHNGLYLAMLAIALIAILTVLAAALRYRSAAQRAESEMAAIVENADDAIIGRDLVGNITSWNKGAERLYGWTEDEAVGKPITIIAPAELQGEMKKILERIKLGKSIDHYETQRMRKDGTLLDVSLTVSAIRDGSGKIIGSSAVARDVTERRQLDRQKSEFIFLASHQLRTPLTAIKWFLEMVLSGDAGKLEETQEKFLKNAFESNERMIDLINDLLSVSRIESGTIELVPVETNLNEMLKGVIDESRPLADAKRIAIEYFPVDLPRIEIDPKLVRQVFMNLISNAIKYTPTGGQVRVSSGREGDFLTFSVKDTGIGVPPEEQPLLFTKFFRATNAAKSDAEGTGLGLYVVKEVVELSGGKLKFESALGQGSTFTFTLPVEGSPPRRRVVQKKILS
ncbi:MAG TPA: ATP-binding protein [Candidatus Baltobacteraceae bacterium]|nr:ATP-binding protein [Candidatus Baltobacteraceae bacterium]